MMGADGGTNVFQDREPSDKMAAAHRGIKVQPRSVLLFQKEGGK